MHGVIPIDSSEFLGTGQSHIFTSTAQVAQLPQTSASQNKAINLPKRLAMLVFFVTALLGVLGFAHPVFLILAVYGLIPFAIMASVLLPIRHAPRARQKRRMKVLALALIIVPALTGIALDIPAAYSLAAYNLVLMVITYSAAELIDDPKPQFSDQYDEHSQEEDYVNNPAYASLCINVYHKS